MALQDSSPSRFKVRLYAILEEANPQDRLAYGFQFAMVILILTNVAAMILETVEPIFNHYEPVFTFIEWFSVAVFSLEYVARLWACTVSPRFAHPVQGRLKYAVTPFAIIDLLAILPFFLPLLQDRLDLRFVRAIRLVRLLRILKLARYTQAFKLFARALFSRKEQLICTLVTLLVFLLGSSSVMYHLEQEAQPDKFASIPDSLWWGIITITTVGYGDVTPVTPLGKLVGGIIAMAGIIFIALPTAIVVSAFLEDAASKGICPHCRKSLAEPSKGDDLACTGGVVEHGS